MPHMTGGEAIVRELELHGVDTVFGLPGAQIYGLFDALHGSNAIRVVGARHEQACGYMAFGYARASGKPGVYSVVPGPGVLNTGAALITALGANEPVLCLTGQVPSEFLGKGRGHLHEMPDQLATLEGLTKWAGRMDHPSLVPMQVGRAFQEMGSLRRGPAALEMPWEQFGARAPVDLAGPLPFAAEPPVDSDRIDEAAKLIATAKAPMIFVGSGAIDAAAEVRALAERLGAPVVGFRSGRGIVSDRHPLGLTIADAYELWADTDVVIGIGTRLEVPGWRWSSRPAGQKTIRIDIDPTEFRRAPGDINVLGGSAAAVSDLIAALEKAGAKLPDRTQIIADARAKAARDIQDIRPHTQYLQAIRDVLPDDGILTDELCQTGFASYYAFPVYQPRTFVSSGYQGTLGSGFATALGAKVARPDVPVVSICGDGGFMFAVQELSTAVQYGIAVTVLVFNNASYGNVRRDQQQRFDGREIASALENPDFMKLADAFGVDGMTVRTPEDLRPALERSFASGRTTLIEIPLELKDEASPWRFIHR